MAKLKNAEKMIQLHIAMMESLDEPSVRQICQALPATDYDQLPGTELRDKVRELIMQCNRRGRLDELAAICSQMRPDFHWEDKATIFETVPAVEPIDEERLVQFLTADFNVADLQQLAFQMGIDFENIEALPQKPSERWLLSMGISPDSISPEEWVIHFKETWSRSFLNECKHHSMWPQVVAAIRICILAE